MEKTRSKEVTITKLSLKKPDDIKTYTETTMNELLGWYGYDRPGRERKSSTTKNGRSHSESNDSEADSVKFTEGCGWCGKPVDEQTSVISASAVFCSELCFSQSRRASFKRNKTCDWCRHIRNTISYVDFQDTAAQLQFCSDKCLNQYKMHIFCRETKAHLELHPHLYGSDASTSGNLITPDLWLKNSTSPKEESPPLSDESAVSLVKSEHIPTITLTPSSKLLSPNVGVKKTRRISRKIRKGCPSTVTSSLSSGFNDIPQDLSIKHAVPEEDRLETAPKIEPEVPSPTVPNIPVCPESAQTNLRSILGSILPPPTTFVPYPVMLPLPIFIPVPIPIPKMFKSNTGKDLLEIKDAETQTDDVDMNKQVLDNNKRLLRKRKPIDVRGKRLIKAKKTVVTEKGEDD